MANGGGDPGGTTRVTCPSCAKALRVPAAAAGKKVRCPACKALFAVPKLAADDAPDIDIVEIPGAAGVPPPPTAPPPPAPARTCAACRQPIPVGLSECPACIDGAGPTQVGPPARKATRRTGAPGRFCTACGQPIPVGLSECPNCVDLAPAAPVGPPARKATRRIEAPPSSGGPNLKPLIGIVTLLLILGVVGGGLFVAVRGIVRRYRFNPGNGPQNAASIQPGETGSARIESQNGEHWWRIDAHPGALYTIALAPGTQSDPAVILLAADQRQIAACDDAPGMGYGAVVSFTTDADATFYAKVVQASENSRGTYDFTLRTSALAADDHPNARAQAEVLQPGRAVNGRLDPCGETDWFRLDATDGAPYTVEVRVDGNAVDPYVTIYDPDGRMLTYNDDVEQGNYTSTAQFTAMRRGPHYIAVTNFLCPMTGPYELVVSGREADDHGDMPPGATPVVLGEPVAGRIAPTGDSDWFKYPCRAGRQYRAEAVPEGAFDPTLEAVSSGGQTSSNDDTPDLGRGARVVFAPDRDGDYFFHVQAFGNGEGAYSFTLYEDGAGQAPTPAAADDHGNDREHATPLAFGASREGAVDPGGDVDWFAVAASGGQRLRAEVRLGTLFDSVLELYDAQGMQLSRSDDAQGDLGNGSALEFDVPATGTLYLAVRAYNQIYTGTYTVSLQAPGAATPTPPTPGPAPTAADDHAGSRDGATPVESETAAAGAIDAANDQDWFTMTLAPGQRVHVEVRLGTLHDSILDVYGPSGGSVASNDDANGGLGSAVDFAATQEGPHFFAVHGFSSNTGTYEIVAVASDPPEPPAPALPEGDDPPAAADGAPAIALNQPQSGSIEPEGDADWYLLDARGGTLYRVEVRLGTLHDSYLELRDASGNSISGNDDAGGDLGMGSALDFTAARTGPLYLVVRALSSGKGTYTILARRTGEQPPDDHANEREGAERLAAGQAVEGEIMPASDTDWFQFAPQAGRRYRAVARPVGSGDPELDLYGAQGPAVAHNDDGGGDLGVASALEFEGPGTTYLVVRSHNSTPLRYSIAVEETGRGDDHPNSHAGATELRSGRRVNAEIDPADDLDYFQIDMREGTRYVIEVRLGTLNDSMLEVEAADGSQVAYNDDAHDDLGMGSRVEYDCAATGTYYLKVRALYGTGTYTIFVRTERR